MIDVDQACKVQPDNTQLLRDLEVTETSLCSNIDGVSVVFSATNRSWAENKYIYGILLIRIVFCHMSKNFSLYCLFYLFVY